MKRFLFYATLVFVTATVYSCNSNTGVKSNPIDSTNANGTAPVEYGNYDTTGMLPDADQGEGNRVNTPGGDSLPATGQ